MNYELQIMNYESKIKHIQYPDDNLLSSFCQYHEKIMKLAKKKEALFSSASFTNQIIALLFNFNNFCIRSRAMFPTWIKLRLLKCFKV